MIQVTRLDNTRMFVNAENIQTLQSTPDTVITFTNNMKMVVRESLDAVSSMIVQYHRLVHANDTKPACGFH